MPSDRAARSAEPANQPSMMSLSNSLAWVSGSMPRAGAIMWREGVPGTRARRFILASRIVSLSTEPSGHRHTIDAASYGPGKRRVPQAGRKPLSRPGARCTECSECSGPPPVTLLECPLEVFLSPPVKSDKGEGREGQEEQHPPLGKASPKGERVEDHCIHCIHCSKITSAPSFTISWAALKRSCGDRVALA
jgi:hypothetical protein